MAFYLPPLPRPAVKEAVDAYRGPGMDPQWLGRMFNGLKCAAAALLLLPLVGPLGAALLGPLVILPVLVIVGLMLVGLFHLSAPEPIRSRDESWHHPRRLARVALAATLLALTVFVTVMIILATQPMALWPGTWLGQPVQQWLSDTRWGWWALYNLLWAPVSVLLITLLLHLSLLAPRLGWPSLRLATPLVLIGLMVSVGGAAAATLAEELRLGGDWLFGVVLWSILGSMVFSASLFGLMIAYGMALHQAIRRGDQPLCADSTAVVTRWSAHLRQWAGIALNVSLFFAAGVGTWTLGLYLASANVTGLRGAPIRGGFGTSYENAAIADAVVVLLVVVCLAVPVTVLRRWVPVPMALIAGMWAALALSMLMLSMRG